MHFAQGISDFGSVGSGFDNMASSVYNRGNSCDARFYTGTGYSGSSFLLARGAYRTDLINYPLPTGDTWNNVISSGKFTC